MVSDGIKNVILTSSLLHISNISISRPIDQQGRKSSYTSPIKENISILQYSESPLSSTTLRKQQSALLAGTPNFNNRLLCSTVVKFFCSFIYYFIFNSIECSRISDSVGFNQIQSFTPSRYIAVLICLWFKNIISFSLKLFCVL